MTLSSAYDALPFFLFSVFCIPDCMYVFFEARAPAEPLLHDLSVGKSTPWQALLTRMFVRRQELGQLHLTWRSLLT
jgi:hypothetical protein